MHIDMDAELQRSHRAERYDAIALVVVGASCAVAAVALLALRHPLRAAAAPLWCAGALHATLGLHGVRALRRRSVGERAGLLRTKPELFRATELERAAGLLERRRALSWGWAAALLVGSSLVLAASRVGGAALHAVGAGLAVVGAVSLLLDAFALRRVGLWRARLRAMELDEGAAGERA